MKALKSIEKDMMTYLRNLFIKKRQPGATHVLLFLLSDERRNKKPFALPVQYVPYHSLRDQFLRDLTNNIKQEMMRMELKTVGKNSYVIPAYIVLHGIYKDWIFPDIIIRTVFPDFSVTAGTLLKAKKLYYLCMLSSDKIILKNVMWIKL